MRGFAICVCVAMLIVCVSVFMSSNVIQFIRGVVYVTSSGWEGSGWEGNGWVGLTVGGRGMGGWV